MNRQTEWLRGMSERINGKMLLVPAFLFLTLFLIAPQGIMIVYSFLQPGVYGGVEWSFTTSNYARVFGFGDTGLGGFDLVYLSIIFRSAKLAMLTVVISLLIGYPAAYWISQRSPGWRNFFLFLVTLPFFANALIRIYSWILILRPSGFINETLLGMGLIDAPLNLLYRQETIVVGLLYAYIPFMVLPLYASIEKLDPSLTEASSDLGAGPIRTFFKVTLPLTAPGIVGGSILVFIPCLGNFIVPTLLGGAKTAMVGSLIEQQFLYARNWPFGAALTFIILSMVLILLIIYVAIESRDEQAAGREGKVE